MELQVNGKLGSVEISTKIIWNYLLFEGVFILLGYSGKHGLLKVKSTFYVAGYWGNFVIIFTGISSTHGLGFQVVT
jgi:hypothetical protein